MIKISDELKENIEKKLTILYGNKAKSTYEELEKILNGFKDINPLEYEKKRINAQNQRKISHEDVILNIYADSIQESNIVPLQVLYKFANKYLKNRITGIHLLPFFEWDTDRGFSVKNYYEVDSRNGDWNDFQKLQEVFDILMIDCVINHASIDNPIIQKALIGDNFYKNFVITFSNENYPTKEEILKITRARPTPPLTKYYLIQIGENEKVVRFNKPSDNKLIISSGWVWTTFSRSDNSDGTVATRQVDLNYTNPQVFLEFIKIILFYISMGARWLRLDAIAYLWKKIGSTCLHLEETHVLIQLLNDVISAFKHLQIVLIGEINEPQENTLQYLTTEDKQESDMIYLFTHFPLAVHAILNQTAKYYMKWLSSLSNTQGRLFVSVLGTHDGMGMKPIGNWLPKFEIANLQQKLIKNHGTLANYAKLPGGEKIVYELCATPWSFINPETSEHSIEIQVKRYLVVLSLGLVIKGVPSIYINGLLGIPNYKGKLDENRSINRQIINLKTLREELTGTHSLKYTILNKILDLISIRRRERAFDLNGGFEVHFINDNIVSVLLYSEDKSERIFALNNLSNNKQLVQIDNGLLELNENSHCIDIISKELIHIKENSSQFMFELTPYQVSWLKKHEK